jgi:hypothetical protein
VYEGDPDVGSQYGGTLLELWMEAKKIKFPPAMAKPYKELAEICKVEIPTSRRRQREVGHPHS